MTPQLQKTVRWKVGVGQLSNSVRGRVGPLP